MFERALFIRRAAPALGALLVVATAAACPDECPSDGSGTLDVVVTGLPDGIAAAVSVDAEAITGSQSLTLDAGAHAVAAAVVAGAAEPIVREAYRGDVDVASACVRNGESTTVTVSYSLVPSSHRLWTAHGNADGNFVAFDGETLATTATVAATAVVSGGMTNPRGVAFDREGNLWTVEGSGTLQMFQADKLGATASGVSAVTITGPALTPGIPGPIDLAFDAAGNLWVAVLAGDRVVRFTPDQLLESGEPTPAVEISGAAIAGPDALAFDADGNLWVAAGGPNDIARYDASRLGASTTDAPDLSLSAETPPPAVGELTAPSGLAFDADGNLWVAYFAANVFARFTPADLALTGTQTLTPEVQVGLTVSALLEGIAFDESGALWTPADTGTLARVTPAQLSASGTVTPEAVIRSDDLGSAAMPAFFPAPSFSPLFAALP